MDTFLPEDAQSQHPDIFTGGGEMGSLMRAFDWSKTPVGPVEQWPQSLRAALGILLRSTYPMFLWWGPDLIQFYNDSYRPSLGMEMHPHALGQPGRESWAEIWPIIGPLIEGVLAGGTSIWNENQFIPITRNGYLEEVYWTYSYSAVLDDNGEVGGVLVVCSETTRQVRAERRLRTLEGITSKAIEAKTAEEIATIADTVFSENTADFPFALLYFLSSDDSQLQLASSVGLAPGTPASPITLELTASSDWGLATVLETGKGSFIEDTAARFGGLPGGIWETPSTSAMVLPIARSGQTRPTGVLVVGISPGQAFDASYRQFLELVAAALAAALANVHAYQDAQKQAHALAELDRAKTTFFNNISHEFRTPLTLSLGPLEMLLSNEQFPLPREQRLQVDMVYRNTVRQLKLVNTLLDFARTEAGQAEALYRPTDLTQLTLELASTFQSAVEMADLQFIVECSPLPEPIYVDHDLWEKIVLNLLSNAFKFTFEGSIRLSLYPVENGVEFIIEDTGIGISESDLPHLFERFYRIHATQARTKEGSGIGLALVQELVHLHGGSIAVESTEGVGSTFKIHLPLGFAHLPEEQIGNTENGSTATSGARSYGEEALHWLPENSSQQDHISANHPSAMVLVVDDNADMREYLKHLLSPFYQLLFAADGNTALMLAQEAHPDLIVSDVMMPGLDGFALLKALRSEQETTSIPVILLSARAGEEAILEGLQTGANDYLVKPFSAREILARVHSQLEITRLHREAELSREYLHNLLMQAPASICVLRGPLHIYELANPLYHQLVSKRELLGKSIREALPELEGQGFYELLDEVYRTGKPFIGNEVRVQLLRDPNQAPTESYFNLVYQPIHTVRGEVEGIMAHAVEVTEQVHTRQRLNSFLGIASHELKNPLTAIKGNVSLAQYRVHKALHDMNPQDNLQQLLEGVALILQRANRQIDFQNRLVNDLVDTARIQDNRLVLRTTASNLITIIDDAVEEQRQLASPRIINLEIPHTELPAMIVDGDRIHQVLTNYLTNALKYSEDEQSILVRVEPQATEIRVTVHDSGPGIPKEDQEHIWERFSRISNVPTKNNNGIGFGVGLYICKTIIELHGGHVGVESEEGAGSTFWFTLPKPAQMPPPPQT